MKKSALGDEGWFGVGFLLPFVVGCFSSYITTRYLELGTGYLGGTVARDTLAFLITGPFFLPGFAFWIPLVRRAILDDGLVRGIGLSMGLAIFQIIGVWVAMFLVYLCTINTFP